jgi:hypothetical protein
MYNIWTNPSSGIIEFNTGAASGNAFDSNLTGAARFTFENSGELNLASYSTKADPLGNEYQNKFTIDSQSGRLFAATTDFDSLFSANNVAGLPILEVYSNGSVIMGDYNSGDFVLTGNQVGIGTTAPASKLHVDGSITSTISQRVDTSTSYTFVIGDQSNIVACANGSAITATVPPNSDVAFPLGAELAVVQAGAGQVTLTAGAGVTLYAADSEVKTRVIYSMAYLYQSSANNWIVAGDLTS